MQPAATIKIFVDAHVFDDEFQGSRTFIREIYTALSEKEDVHLFLAARDIGNLERNFPARENISFIRYRSSSAIIRLVYDIPRIIRKYGIRYAHFQYIIPVFKNCRFIVTTHDLLFNEYPRDFPFLYRLARNILFRRGAKKADILTTVSEYSKRSIVKYFGIEDKNVHIIPNGVSNLFFEGYDKEEAKKYIKSRFAVEKMILVVSRIEPRKNHVLLLRAFLELGLHEKGYSLVFIGKKSIHTNALDEAMNSLPKKNKPFVFMYNDINQNDLLKFYQAAEVFVYPSRAEGFGIPPLEAAAVKVPVLCSSSSAMADFDFFGEDHVDPVNYTQFRNRLRHLINNEPDKNELEKVSAIVQQRYNWKRSAEILYELIKAGCN